MLGSGVSPWKAPWSGLCCISLFQQFPRGVNSVRSRVRWGVPAQSTHRARVLPGFWEASRELIERTRERPGRVGRRDLGIEKMRERQAAGPQGVRDAGCRMLRTGPESAVQSGSALEHYSIGEAAHWLVALRRW